MTPDSGTTELVRATDPPSMAVVVTMPNGPDCALAIADNPSNLTRWDVVAGRTEHRCRIADIHTLEVCYGVPGEPPQQTLGGMVHLALIEVPGHAEAITQEMIR